jgi:hypothetical protein
MNQQNRTKDEGADGSDENNELRADLGVSIPRLVDRLEGRSSKLRKSKPTADGDNGLIAYIWRMARFHSGADTSMPVMCSHELQEYLDERGIDASVTGITDERGSEITDELDEVTIEVCKRLDLDPRRGAATWAATGAI